jgi:hypothetical protein
VPGRRLKAKGGKRASGKRGHGQMRSTGRENEAGSAERGAERRQRKAGGGQGKRATGRLGARATLVTDTLARHAPNLAPLGPARIFLRKENDGPLAGGGGRSSRTCSSQSSAFTRSAPSHLTQHPDRPSQNDQETGAGSRRILSGQASFFPPWAAAASRPEESTWVARSAQAVRSGPCYSRTPFQERRRSVEVSTLLASVALVDLRKRRTFMQIL